MPMTLVDMAKHLDDFVKSQVASANADVIEYATRLMASIPKEQYGDWSWWMLYEPCTFRFQFSRGMQRMGCPERVYVRTELLTISAVGTPLKATLRIKSQAPV